MHFSGRFIQTYNRGLEADPPMDSKAEDQGAKPPKLRAFLSIAIQKSGQKLKIQTKKG